MSFIQINRDRHHGQLCGAIAGRGRAIVGRGCAIVGHGFVCNGQFRGRVKPIFLICLLEFELWLVRKDLYIPEPGARNTELGTWGLGYGMLQACRPRTLDPGPG